MFLILSPTNRAIMKCVRQIGIVILVLIGFSANVMAQGSLGLYLTQISTTTPAIGQSVIVQAKLINTSTTETFSGIVDFSMANENGLITDFTVFNKPNYSGTLVTLAPLEEKQTVTVIDIEGPYFVAGPDIIIVWPLAACDIVDSIKINLDIQVPTGINEVGDNATSAFVANNQLIVQNNVPNINLQRVQLFDVTGKVMGTYALSDSNATIPLSELPRGMYIAEITTTNGIHKTIRFVR